MSWALQRPLHSAPSNSWSFIQQNDMCVSLQQRALENMNMQVSVQCRVPNCRKVAFRHSFMLVLRGYGVGGGHHTMGGGQGSGIRTCTYIYIYVYAHPVWGNIMYYVSQLCFGHHCPYFFLGILKLETIIFLFFLILEIKVSRIEKIKKTKGSVFFV